MSALVESLKLEGDELETLLFRLAEADLVLVAAKTRLVPQALADVEDVVVRLRRAETDRGKAVASLVAGTGVAQGDLTLDLLVAGLPEHVSLVVKGHRDRFMSLAGEIERVTLGNPRLATHAVRNIVQSIGRLAGRTPEPASSHLGEAFGGLQERMVSYQAMLGSSSKAFQPSLVDFLR